MAFSGTRTSLWRELLAESRRSLNYTMRLVMGGSVFLLLVLWQLSRREMSIGRGAELLGEINTVLYIGIWVLIPVMSADCISRERREGTLGLLFLTPLLPSEVVCAKGIVHALRSFTLLLSALPILTVAVLMGGVSGSELLRVGMLDAAAVAAALACGICASARTRDRTRAVILALTLAAGCLSATLLCHGITFFGGLPSLGSAWTVLSGTVRGAVFNQPVFVTGLGMPGWRVPMGAGLVTRPLLAAGGVALVSLNLTVLVVVTAARALRRENLNPEKSARVRRWTNVWCTPVFWKGFFRNRMTRTLNRNPIGWLQQYSWSARLSKWGWCLLLVFYEVAVLFVADYSDLMEAQAWPVLALAAGMSFSAANSFGRERESGAMELLLVTPLREGQIIDGRLFGLWRQFLPAVLAWLSIWWVLRDRSFEPIRMGLLVTFAGALTAVSVIGLYFSLRQVHLMVAWLATALAGVILPWAVTLGLSVWLELNFLTLLGPATLSALLQLLLAWWARRRMQRNLVNRSCVMG
jgi:ABC-type transport system involved in multi-copper enzyme maturation permease subunit